MELIAEGRMAEVYLLQDGTVVKLDRVEFNGVAEYEAGIMREVIGSGLPVPRVRECVVIDGRHGIVMDRLDGTPLSELIQTSNDLGSLATKFVALQVAVQHGQAPSAPNLVARLVSEIERTDLPAVSRMELVARAQSRESDARLCHFDFHPGNVIVTEAGWTVIDWLTAASGPVIADFARTLLLRADATDDQTIEFMARVRAEVLAQPGIDRDALDWWTRIVAAARLVEGFTGEHARRLRAIALGAA